MGLLVGILTFVPQMLFLWTIFGPVAIPLWLVLSFWIGLFVAMGRSCREHFGPFYTALLLPFLWTGLEYFRSELYYLRFSWLNPGYVFANNIGWLPMKHLGVYGLGFLLMGCISLCSLLFHRHRILAYAALLIGLCILTNLPARPVPAITASAQDLQVAGMQMEFPSEPEVRLGLNQLAKKYPQAQLLVLSEYTFDGPVPEQIKNWCKQNNRYLVAGGKDAAPDSQYYNTAFVIGPAGNIVFRQAKSVPIQFFKDGLPAKEQKLWASPWGNIGLCICYDLSYSRVTDQLIRLGAQAIIVPTMDVVDWGRHQHELHARVAPMRSAEYGIPIFRLASSGISQCVNSGGHVESTAPMPGDEATLSGTLHLAGPGTLPWDRVIAPLSVCVTATTAAWQVCACLRRKKNPLPTPN